MLIGIGGWGLQVLTKAGNWRLATGGWRLGTADWGVLIAEQTASLAGCRLPPAGRQYPLRFYMKRRIVL